MALRFEPSRFFLKGLGKKNLLGSKHKAINIRLILALFYCLNQAPENYMYFVKYHISKYLFSFLIGNYTMY